MVLKYFNKTTLSQKNSIKKHLFTLLKQPFTSKLSHNSHLNLTTMTQKKPLPSISYFYQELTNLSSLINFSKNPISVNYFPTNPMFYSPTIILPIIIPLHPSASSAFELLLFECLPSRVERNSSGCFPHYTEKLLFIFIIIIFFLLHLFMPFLAFCVCILLQGRVMR